MRKEMEIRCQIFEIRFRIVYNAFEFISQKTLEVWKRFNGVGRHYKESGNIPEE